MRIPSSLRWGVVAIAVGVTIGAMVNALGQSPGTNSVFPATWTLPYSSIQRTYSVAYQLSPAGQATDIAQICGNASNLVKVTRVSIAGRATAVSAMDVWLLRRSGQDTNSAGAISPTANQADSLDAAPQSFVNFYWANPTTLATLTAVVANLQTYVGNLTTGTPGAPIVFEFGNLRAAKSNFLRGVNQCLVVNLSGTSQGANLDDITFEWTEE